jgi:hypothetical protein
LYHKSDAIDWFVRQPTIVEKVFNLIDVGEDGGVRVRSPEALKALAGVIAESDSVSLVELLEDCGIYLHAGLPSEQTDG